MIWLLPGGASFLLFCWFDWRKLHHRRGGAIFAAGVVLLGGSAAMLLLGSRAAYPDGRGFFRCACGVSALLFLAALVYVLFFALPAKETYVGETAALCDRGVYGRCRHPGFWPFLAAALCAGVFGGTAEVWAGMALFSGLDLLYIVLQDVYFFPRTIPGYAAYRRGTPFLIPRRGGFPTR